MTCASLAIRVPDPRINPPLPPRIKVSYPRRMTIAAGFVCRDSVLLCADTEYRGWATKSHHAKIGSFDCPGGQVAFALAGNTAFAWSAIQKLKKRLEATPPSETITIAERVLEKEYRR